MKMEEFADEIAKSLYGKTRKEAVESGNCIQCNQPALQNCYSEAGRREFAISGLCEKCFDQITEEE